MDQTAPPRRSFWQFSLRELLLVMLVIALVLGWGRSIYQAYISMASSCQEGAPRARMVE